MSDAIVEVKNLKKYFQVKNGLLHAVDDVNFVIPKGTTMGLVGESGCGKSTIGRLILRLTEATEGEILFEGQDIRKLNKKDMRIFRFSRMRNVEILEENFKSRVLDKLHNGEIHRSHQMTEIVIRVEKDMEYRVLDEFCDKDVIQNVDGSFTVKMSYIEDFWLCGYILSFGPFATVITPLDLRKTIEVMLEKMSENYSSKI